MQSQNFLKNLWAASLTIILLSVISCAPVQRTELDSTQRYGGGGGTVPNYGNQGYVPAQPMYQQPYYQQPQQQQPYYQQPQYRSNYQQNVVPGSRFYSNPYAIPPTTQYPQYDADQYYVPPTYYQNIEPDLGQYGQ